MKKSLIEWFAYILLFIWQLPQNIVGFFMWLFFKICGSVSEIGAIKWSSAYKSRYMRGGISLGIFCFLDSTLSRYPAYIAHELVGHTKQSRMLGFLYLPIVGLSSLLHAWLYDPEKSCYYDFWCEDWANCIAKLGVDKYCHLYVKYSKR